MLMYIFMIISVSIFFCRLGVPRNLFFGYWFYCIFVLYHLGFETFLLLLISWVLEFVSVTGLNRAGPLVEYERRILAGELVDGDSCQVTLSTFFWWKWGSYLTLIWVLSYLFPTLWALNENQNRDESLLSTILALIFAWEFNRALFLFLKL